ncbi:protein-glutamate methylesterase/protein-glutamine glutaminase [Reichenbachiella ulvae]|uniref:Protein-glutamate methylesterase/protein-glutamine glutaminase n=1 Tax=Reichenbachiella ulvae TaxID=2980104 RepID=A0ABT3CRN6_9BACT|nr:chemotaxis response regulator protein-glutamate methylesterase [Reichenbachiella ulvae]MCV9386376.1 chemotaxis response regulator protein-glutamate methylesterase [Reichenbachiella ulvae]
MSSKIKILIIDDSRSVQKMMEFVFSQSSDIEVVGAAHDAYEAVEILREVKPNVILLDVRMPRMDGLTFLKKLMNQHPIPTIVFSSLITKNPEIGVRALEYGAVAVMDKPVIDFQNLKSTMLQEKELIDMVRTFGNENLPKRSELLVDRPKKLVPIAVGANEKIDTVICIGASAGGTQAMKEVLLQLPVNFPPILVVQHMPVEFTGQYAQYLNDTCAIHVKEAENNEMVTAGTVYIAPGDQHLTMVKAGNGYRIKLLGGPKVSGHIPSVDVLFDSAANQLGEKAIGLIMTGMGKDGAEGLLKMKINGAYTLAQNEASCVVFGMPKEAIALGAADRVCSLKDIPLVLHDLAKKKHRK